MTADGKHSVRCTFALQSLQANLRSAVMVKGFNIHTLFTKMSLTTGTLTPQSTPAGRVVGPNQKLLPETTLEIQKHV